MPTKLLRGPRWKDEHADAVGELLEEYHRETRRLTEEERAKATELLTSDSYRYIRMLAFGPTLAGILGSMHWTLVGFGSPVIATSDHPVVTWPGARARRPEAAQLRAGILECIEVRLPLSPMHLVLITWADRPDDEETQVRGHRHHAR